MTNDGSDGSQGSGMVCCGVDLAGMIPPETFKALADSNRLAIISFLANAADSVRVGDVAECCPVDLSVVSRHIGLLRDAGIVECIKRGREVRCRLRVPELVSALRGLADALERSAQRAEQDSDAQTATA